MAGFREEKEELRSICRAPDWKTALEDKLLPAADPARMVSPLLALLSRPDCVWQAAYGLGLVVPAMAQINLESARVVMRRLMWSLNEESGNLGWGVPESMACILCNSAVLAGEYARIFLSYGYETGKDDNFLDHAPLRRGQVWGVGRLAQGRASLAAQALPHLTNAMQDADGPIRAFAAWSAGRLAQKKAELEIPGPLWQEARQTLKGTLEREIASSELRLTYFDGQDIVEQSATAIMEEALAVLR